MSGWIFPTSLPGLKMAVKRRRIDKTIVQEAASGKEWRATWWTMPRWRYTVGFEFLRRSDALPELQRLATHLATHAGAFDSFLLADPEDSTVTDHGFGAGDGTTTVFQLQRTRAGTRASVKCECPVATVPRTNRLLASQDFTNGAWTKRGSASVAASIFTTAPDGTRTGQWLRMGAITVDDLYQYAGVPRGVPYTPSLWINRLASATGSITIGNPAGSAYGTMTVPLTALPAGVWTRVHPGLAGVTVTTPFVGAPLDGGNAGINIGFGAGSLLYELNVWGAQVEVGSVMGEYVPTTTGALASATPSYWPSLGDGYEPIFEVGVDAAISLVDTSLGRRRQRTHYRSNLLTQSTDLSQAGTWTLDGSTVATGATAPDGTSTAWTITAAAATAIHGVTHAPVSVATATRFVLSGYFKRGSYATIRFGGRLNTDLYADFNLDTQTVTANPLGVPTRIEPLDGGWFRLSLVAPSGGNAIPFCSLNSGASYLGAGETVVTWGWMLEPIYGASDDVPGEYLPTAAAGVARTGGDVTIDYTTGLVTFVSAPPAGDGLIWSGTFYRRVRLPDEVDSERIFSHLWSADAIDLLTVKP